MRNPEPGLVYVLANPAMPNHVKVGRTTGSSEVRAQQLSYSTGVPTPFCVVYDEEFDDCCAAEARVHALLEEQGLRPNPNREFFTAPVKDVIKLVQRVKQELGASTAPRDATALVEPDIEPDPPEVIQERHQVFEHHAPADTETATPTWTPRRAIAPQPLRPRTKIEHQCDGPLSEALAEYQEWYACPYVDTRYIGKHWLIENLAVANHDGRIQLLGSITYTWHQKSPARVILDIRLSGTNTNEAYVFTAVLEGMEPQSSRVFSIPTRRSYETGIASAQIELRFLNH